MVVRFVNRVNWSSPLRQKTSAFQWLKGYVSRPALLTHARVQIRRRERSAWPVMQEMIPSREGSQKRDAMSSLEFCEAIQPVLNDLYSEANIGPMDEVSLASDVSTLEK